MKLFFTLCLSFCVAFAKHELYDGYVVYEVYPNNLDEIKTIHEVVNELTLDIWSYPNLVDPGQIFVSEAQKEPFENALKIAGIAYEATVEKIRELLELEDQMLGAAAAKRSRNNTDLNLDTIYTFDQAMDYVEAIASNYPNVTRLVNAGYSLEGRPIQYLEISKNGFRNSSNPVIFINSLLHAREWITLPITLYAIEKLVVNVTESDLSANIDWVILPVSNPDGYIFSHTTDRFWRKNRRTGQAPNNTCVGVDLNRNFDIDWARLSSFDVCSNTFHGRRPVSEPETEAVVNVLSRYRNRMAMFADMHSHGSMVLYGWGNGTLIPNALEVNYVAVKMAQAIDRVKWAHKPNYRVGNTVDILRYTVSGGSTDYGSAIGILYSYTYELPSFFGSSGVNGFLVDPAFIKQAAVETWAGVVAGARHILGTN